MSLDVTWPRTTPLSAEEILLRNIFQHVGVSPDLANNAALRSMVEHYRDAALSEAGKDV